MLDMTQVEWPEGGEARLRRVGGGREVRGFFLRAPRRGESLVLWEPGGHVRVRTSPVARILGLRDCGVLYLMTESGSRYRWEILGGISSTDSQREALL